MSERTVPAEVLSGDDLPSLPSVAVEVLRLCRSEDATLDDLAEAIARDPALSAKLLRYSNSSLFNLGAEVTTLQRATLVLGMKSVQLMSLSFSLASALPRSGRDFDYDTFWRRSLAQAVASRLMASLTGGPSEDEAFLCGLLANVGQLMLAKGRSGYERVLEDAGDRWPAAEDELRVLGFHRGDVARELLGAWSLPPIIHLGVGYMHDPAELPEEIPAHVRELVEVLHVARLAVDVLCGGSGEALVELEERCATRFSLSEEQVREYLLALEGAFREAAALLDLPMPTERSHEDILVEARSAMFQVGLATAGELRAHDRTPDLSHREAIVADGSLRETSTGLLGRDGFERFLRAEVAARAAGPVPHAVGVLLIGLDEFDDLRSGGPDLALEAQRAVAIVLQRMTRKGDVPARTDDGRFAVLVPQASPFGLRTLAERVRIGVGQHPVRVGKRERGITVSCGGVCLDRADRAGADRALLEVAQRYLARAAARGDASFVHPTVIRPEADAA